MKKYIIFSLLGAGLLAAAISFAQKAPAPVTKRAIKKEDKMDKKAAKGKLHKGLKKEKKMDKKDDKLK